MWKPAREIQINAHSLVDLKQELYKKKSEFEQGKQSSSEGTTAAPKPTKAAHPRKRVKPAGQSNAGVKERARKDEWMRDYKMSLSDPVSARRMAVMKEKAALYQRLSRGEFLNDSERQLLDHEDVMVDFDRKHLEEDTASLHDTQGGHSDTDTDERVQVRDEFGRERWVPKSQAHRYVSWETNVEDDYKDYASEDTAGYHMFPPVYHMAKHQVIQEAQKRQEEADHEFEDLLLKSQKRLAERYDPLKDLRDMGTSYYKFSNEEEERAKEKEQLDDLHKQTLLEKERQAKAKLDRKKRMQDRLDKIKKRRLETQGPAESTSQPDPEEEVEAFLKDTLT